MRICAAGWQDKPTLLLPAHPQASPQIVVAFRMLKRTARVNARGVALIDTEAAPALLRTVLYLCFVENSQDLSKSHGKTYSTCYQLGKDLYSFYRILAGQSGRFAFGIARRTFGLSYHYIDEPS
ncbi:hypothetical protein [Microvirga zambiensis]|uniref:hypothetical protein n=1 Tax=Microvirga zambiensis TaxID=1402137 RepID=UPI001AEF7269|nr:hypothetical protein [Microvirga zambiensis]